MWITAPNSSSISVHGAPARPAAACRSESARTVIAAASSGMSSAWVRHITTAPAWIAPTKRAGAGAPVGGAGRGGPRGAHHQLEPHQPSGEVFLAVARADPFGVLLDAAFQHPMLVAESGGEIADRLVAV